MTSEMVESAWISMGYYLHYLDQDIRKLTRSLERLHLKVWKGNNYWSLTEYIRWYIYIYIYIYGGVFKCIWGSSSSRMVKALYCDIVVSKFEHLSRYFVHVKNISSSSSSSCHAASMDIPDPLLPLLPIVHRFWSVLRDTSRILKEQLCVCLSRSTCFDSFRDRR